MGLASLTASVPKNSRQPAPATLATQPQSGEQVRMLQEAPSLLSFMSAPKIAGMKSSNNLPTVLKESRAALKNMKKAGDATSDIYGWMIYSSSATLGWNQLGYDGSLTPVFDSETLQGANYLVDAVWFDNGKVGMMVSCQDDQYIYGFWYYLFDAAGNEEKVVKLDNSDLFYRCAYSYKDKKVYGFNFSEDGAFQWSAFDPATETFEVVAPASTSNYTGRGMTYNSKENCMIGLKSGSSSNVYKIDPATGDCEVVGSLELPAYIFGFGYSEANDCYLLNQVSTSACSLDCLDPTTFAVTSSAPYSGIVEFSQIVQTEPVEVPVDAAAPNATDDLAVSFVKNSYSGKVSFTLPSATVGGYAIMGDVAYVVNLDGQPFKRGKGAAGSQVSYNVTTDGEGMHTITVVCSLGTKQSREASIDFYTGNDTPMPPAKVTMNGKTVSWTAVTEGIHAGYVDAAAVTYNVYLNGTQIATNVEGTECPSNIDPSTPIEYYVAEVEAVFDGKVSEKTSSDAVAYGGPLALPVEMTPTPQQAALFTIVNANEDTKTITYLPEGLKVDDEYYPVFRYLYHSSNDADDWLFLPAINFDDANKLYSFSMNAFRHSSSYEEQFEVKLATAPSPDAVVADIMPATVVDNAYTTDYSAELANVYTQYFGVPSAGAYYVGIHVISEKDNYFVMMRDFKVSASDNLTVASPAAATDLTAVAAANGVLTADVTFKLPATDYAGNPYAADKDITAKVSAANCPEVSVSGKAGAEVTATVTTVQGDNTITVTPYDGTIPGIPAEVVVYTGVSAPDMVGDFKGVISEDNMSVKITWTAPTEGSDGGYINTTGLTYYLTEVDADGYWALSKNLGEDVFETTVTLPTGAPQDGYIYGIVAQNEAGFGDVTGDNFMMGTPLPTPVMDNYNDGIDVSPLFTYKSTGQTAYFTLNCPSKVNSYLSQYATDDLRVGLVCRPATYSTSAYEGCGFILPRMATTGLVNPSLGLEVCAGSVEKMYVYVSTYGVEETLLATYDKADYADLAVNNVTELTLDLPEQFKNKQWVEVKILADAASRSEALIIYSFKVFDNIDNDFAVTAINGPANAKIGVENTFTVTVANLGMKESPNPGGKWVLTDSEGNVAAEVNVEAGEENVASGDVENHTISYNPSADDLGTYKLTYTLATTDDKAENNSNQIEFTVVKGLDPVVTDLAATDITFDKVTLGWSLNVGTGDVVDSFEEETPFVLDDASDMIGEFKRVDGDGKSVYGSQAENFPNIPGAYGPSSFLVWNEPQVDEILGTTGSYPAKTGEQFLIAFCPSDASQADDWLISPAIIGGSDVSFALRALTYQYGAEVVELMVSTTNDTPESFEVYKTIEVMEEGVQRPSWQEYTYTLPEDAKYFALHYVSTDIFGIMIDDIAYAPYGSDVTVDGYTVFRNDEKLATIGKFTSYDDETVEADTDYTYYIIPTLSTGKDGLKSNTVAVRTSGVSMVGTSKAIYSAAGCIVVKGYEGKAVSIVSADGVVRAASDKASASGRYTVAPGIYIVKAGNDVVKLTVK